MIRRFGAVAAAGLVALLCGCGGTSEDALQASLSALRTPPSSAPASSAPSKAAKPSCAHATWSLRPGAPADGAFVDTIRRRASLIAGVDQNTLLLGYANPLHRQRIEGFEIDLLHELSTALFGQPDRIEFRALTTAGRLQAVQDGTVDILADAVTINCERVQQVAFSTVYLSAVQKVLVPSTSRARSLKDLNGKRVCATQGSTSIAALERYPGVIPHPVAQRTDCLVALQRGEADAITSDDAILLGFQAQDPYTKVIGAPIEAEPYGMAISKRHPEFVRFVNGVLARMRADGTWRRLYQRWLPGSPRQPPVRYRD
jgi:polar amino acid transport system substrate-binding protein